MSQAFLLDEADRGVSGRPEKEDITQHEIEALEVEHNLADAHPHQRQSHDQRQIVGALPSLWYSSEKSTQRACELAFKKAFYSFHGQHAALERVDDIYLTYAASVSMQVVSTYLRQHNCSVGLVEPCFDNLHDLMKHTGLEISPIHENVFYDRKELQSKLDQYARNLDAIVLVDPNNPTGFSLLAPDDEAFREVVDYCKKTGKILILDFCFSAFIRTSGYTRPDTYKILEESGVDYIAMEDTGKTWPLQDAKCASLLASRSLNGEIYSIITSVLLNVSPFILSLVTEYVEKSREDGLASVSDVLNSNRQFLIENLPSGVLAYEKPRIETSVAWLKIKTRHSADEIQAYLRDWNVYVLPGRYFFWSQPSDGRKYIRVALARDPEKFRLSILVATTALKQLPR